ncbi:hypothetical protein H4Q26_003621 [Puccinia striiformis f. sp. tritici PST-130]|nr:hypothetical protein H4Q26_003621 [Puccinia striiformis f. sp. tritici PST-130]
MERCQHLLTTQTPWPPSHLDFIRLKERHTGVYLADTVRCVVESFGVQDKIFGIVTKNASNNQTMIKEIQKFKWP